MFLQILRVVPAASVLVSLCRELTFAKPEAALADGVLPITQTFKSSRAPAWAIAGTAYLAAPTVDPEGQGWLRLGQTGSNEAGYAYYDTSLLSSQGIHVEFEYTSRGCTNPGADGLGFFLFDGSTPSFRIGDAGGSPGGANGCGTTRGLSNGYVGIACRLAPHRSQEAVPATWLWSVC